MQGIYLELYKIISEFLFNGQPSEMVYGELICQGIPAIICSILIFLPFIIVWRIIRRFI